MEAATISQIQTVPRFSSSSVSTPKVAFFTRVKGNQIWVKQRALRFGQVPRLECAKGGSVSGMEKKLGNEFDTEEELVGMKQLNENCKGTVGLVELLECLEREAIMGADEGREPTDYDRRARIFDKSSRVFQALKESSSV